MSHRGERAVVVLVAGVLVLTLGACRQSPTNRAPIVVSYQVETPEDTPTLLALAGVDPDGDELTWAIVTPPEHGTLSGELPQPVYMPEPDFSGTDWLVFSASDGSLVSDPAILTIVVRGTNDGPRADAGLDQFVSTGRGVLLDARGSGDVDGDVLAYQWRQLEGPPVEIDDTANERPWFTAPEDQAELLFELRVQDAEGLFDTDLVRISVLDETAPSPPRNFVARALPESIQLSWELPPQVDLERVVLRRHVVRYPRDARDGTAVYDGMGLDWLDEGLTNGTTYFYSLFAADEVPLYSGPARADATPRVGVLPRYPLAGSGWNDYLRNDGTTRLTALDLPCAATSPGAYDACIHGGEIRAVDARGLSSCLDVTAQDDLGAFDWVCVEEPDGPSIVSTGLRDQVRLVELIDRLGEKWRENAVTVYLDGRQVIRTPPGEWWSNPIVVDPATVALDVPGAVYVLTRDVDRAYSMVADRVTVISAPNARLGSLSTRRLLEADGASFLWVEVETAGRQAVRWVGVRRSVLRHVHVDGLDPTTRSVYLLDNTAILVRHFTGRNTGEFACLGCQDCALEDIDLTGSRGLRVSGSRTNVTGVRIEGGSGLQLSGEGHIARDLVIQNVSTHGVWISGTGHRIENVLVVASVIGVSISGSGHELVSLGLFGNGSGLWLAGDASIRRVTATGNGTGVIVHWYSTGSLGNVVASNNSTGIILRSNAMSVSGVLATNNNGLGVDVEGFGLLQNVTTANNRFAGVAAKTWVAAWSSVLSSNNGFGLYVWDVNDITFSTFSNIATTDNEQYGLHLYGGDFFFSGALVVGGNGGVDCVVSYATGLVDTTCANEGQSDASLYSGATVENSFVGKVTTDDPLDASDIDGWSGPLAITDLIGFGPALRVWGADGGAFPDASNRGRCFSASQDCRVWDWRLRASDTTVRDMVAAPTGDDVFPLPWGGMALRGAVELDDGIGNDDLACESGEGCVYSPNIGVYQGHGALIPHSFIGTGGLIENVTLYAYEFNGG